MGRYGQVPLRKTVVGAVQANVAPGTTVHTDGLAGHNGLPDKAYAHWVNCISRGHRLKGRRPADVYLSGKTASPNCHFSIAL